MKHLAFLLFCVACSPTNDVLPSVENDTCNATAYAGLIGQPDTDLERVLILGAVRVIRPDSVVTTDFLAERINFIIDETSSISAVQCG